MIASIRLGQKNDKLKKVLNMILVQVEINQRPNSHDKYFSVKYYMYIEQYRKQSISLLFLNDYIKTACILCVL